MTSNQPVGVAIALHPPRGIEQRQNTNLADHAAAMGVSRDGLSQNGWLKPILSESTLPWTCTFLFKGVE